MIKCYILLKVVQIQQESILVVTKTSVMTLFCAPILFLVSALFWHLVLILLILTFYVEAH